ncbi:MAG: hypothetical protein MJY56_05835 [Bacteroidales bacterium]|nr:hypothetical protein [Bacteroidales bacterium]
MTTTARLLLCALFALSCSVSNAEEKWTDKPDRQWTVYLVQHTHTDIGYTKPQSEILSEHLRYIDYAVDYAELTREYPEGCRFRWTCEAAWAVSEYLKVRPETQIRRLKECIRRGEIEVTGMYFNMAEIADEQSLRYFFHPLSVLKEQGLPVNLAMQNDVNGVAWCMADYLYDLGIRYFWIGSNKTKSLLPFNVPTIYRWESPSGKPLVMYRSEHYNTANFWGIERGDVEKFEQESAAFLERIAPEYPFDEIGTQFSGVFVDNAPPAWNACDFVKEWNETHDNPKLHLATASEFLSCISEKYPAEMLPEHKVAYPDWWTDGFGSAAKETGEARKAHASMMGVTGLMAMNLMHGGHSPEGMNEEVEGIYNNLLFYDEHTFGAAESIWEPACWNSQIQFDNKSSYAWNGLRRAKLMFETAGGLLQEGIRPMGIPTVTLFNPLGWDRSAMATVFVDFEVCPADKELELTAEDGSKACVQAMKEVREGRYYRVYADDVPAMGYRTYSINASEKNVVECGMSTSVLENSFYRIEMDRERGGVSSIVEISSGRELVDREAEWPLGAFIYETVDDRMGTLFQFRSEGMTRYGLTNVRIEPGVIGNLYRSLKIKGNAPTVEGDVTIEVRLYENEPKIEFAYSMNRLDEYGCNSVYVAFPFGPSDGRLSMDVQGGIMRPGENQLEGSSSDWNTMQNYVSVGYEGGQTLITSPEIPMIMAGSLLKDEPFHYIKTYEKPHVFSWVMNNHWCTNFQASQSGEFNWSYVITSTDDTSDATALRFGLSERVELYPRVIPAKAVIDHRKEKLPLEWRGLHLESGSDGVVITSMAPASFRKGIILQVRNVSDAPAEARFIGARGRTLRVRPVNALEERLGRRTRTLKLSPGADVFVLI